MRAVCFAKTLSISLHQQRVKEPEGGMGWIGMVWVGMVLHVALERGAS